MKLGGYECCKAVEPSTQTGKANKGDKWSYFKV